MVNQGQGSQDKWGAWWGEHLMVGSQHRDHPGTSWLLTGGALRLPGNQVRSPGHALPKPDPGGLQLGLRVLPFSNRLSGCDQQHGVGTSLNGTF